MANTRNTLPLKGRSRGVEGPSGAKKQVVPGPLLHACEQIAREDRGTAATARASAVNILLIGIENQDTAISVPGSQVDFLFPEQIQQQFSAQLTQISGDNQVIEVGRAACICKMSLYGVKGSRG